jgi:hypothetical protein
MLQIKIFNDEDTKRIENDFNNWIEEESPRIVEWRVSEDLSSKTLWVMYNA